MEKQRFCVSFDNFVHIWTSVLCIKCSAKKPPDTKPQTVKIHPIETSIDEKEYSE
jgi:hypothetical protein